MSETTSLEQAGVGKANPASTDIAQAMHLRGKRARIAAGQLLLASSAAKSKALLAMADAVDAARAEILSVNAADVAAARAASLEPALLERLALSSATIDHMITGLRQIAGMDDPVGALTAGSTRPNGMHIAQMRVPLGVVAIVYESRPNVTIDAAALCLKAGNACILRGGSEALNTNQVLARLIRLGLEAASLPADAVQVVDIADRAAVGALITMSEYVDVLIPRGGKGLVEFVSKEARIPLLKHLDGNCHVYVDAAAEPLKAIDIAFNAKTYRYGVCGAMETLLVHVDLVESVLAPLARKLINHGVELRGCERTRAVIPSAKAATDLDWATEYLGPILAIRVVDSLDDAMAHIARWGSQHTDAIVTESIGAAARFQREVDSSSVYVNLPTCFADGFEYGLGAEIGISTNRLHARGPVGLEGLTTLKWVLSGNGQLRG